MEVQQIEFNGVTINKTDGSFCWRLIHNGKDVIDLSKGIGVVYTQLNVFLANSKEACLAEIYKLNLEYYPSEEEEL